MFSVSIAWCMNSTLRYYEMYTDNNDDDDDSIVMLSILNASRIRLPLIGSALLVSLCMH